MFGFLSFGLHRQKQQQRQQLSSEDGPTRDTPPLQPFLPAWYSRPIPESSAWDAPASSRRLNSRGAAVASSLAPDQGRSGEGIAAGMAGAQRNHPSLRFSRKVSLSILTRRRNFSHASVRSGAEEDLPFLALCRVLLNRVHEVDAAAACDADIEEAVRRGCDAVHATQRFDQIVVFPIYVVSRTNYSR